MKKIFIFLMIIVFSDVLNANWLDYFSKKSDPSPETNALLLGSGYKGPAVVFIPVHPLADLDFKSKSEIEDSRRFAVREHSFLLANEYKPDQRVFGSLQDGKPWWGVDGVMKEGPGPSSMKGYSKESQSINNPFLLVTVGEKGAYVVNFPTRLTPLECFPNPVSISYEPSKKIAKARVAISNYLEYQNEINAQGLPAHLFELIAYNARDFGFNFIFIDPDTSFNIDTQNLSPSPCRIKQYIHTGGSCGASEGCNNMSPDQPELTVNVLSTPATVNIKLWKQEPKSLSDPADLIYTLELE